MSDADYSNEEQDQAEVFDEDIMGDEGVGPSADMRVFEELPDVYDVTSRVGDADVDDDLAASDADELDDDDLDDLEVDIDDDDDLDTSGELPEDDEVFDDDDLDDVDGVDDLEDDEVDLESVGDVDDAGDDDEAADYESEDELSDEDVQELGYADPDEIADDEEEEEVDEKEDPSHGQGLVPGGRGRPAQGHSGEAADLAADRVHVNDLDELDLEDRQDVLLDEGVEETFPASDPVSVKRIT